MIITGVAVFLSSHLRDRLIAIGDCAITLDGYISERNGSNAHRHNHRKLEKIGVGKWEKS
jgi:hypothetical protein